MMMMPVMTGAQTSENGRPHPRPTLWCMDRKGPLHWVPRSEYEEEKVAWQNAASWGASWEQNPKSGPILSTLGRNLQFHGAGCKLVAVQVSQEHTCDGPSYVAVLARLEAFFLRPFFLEAIGKVGPASPSPFSSFVHRQ